MDAPWFIDFVPLLTILCSLISVCEDSSIEWILEVDRYSCIYSSLKCGHWQCHVDLSQFCDQTRAFQMDLIGKNQHIFPVFKAKSMFCWWYTYWSCLHIKHGCIHPWTEVVYQKLERKNALFYIFDSTGSVWEFWKTFFLKKVSYTSQLIGAKSSVLQS